jgi:two-component system NtrC family sensor kinase
VKVLLADDDRVFRILLGRLLPKWGYKAIIVEDGEAAWEHIADAAGPSIAILDWVMPGVDGLEVCRRARSGHLSRYVYIILLTSKGSSGNLTAGFEAGADDYLSKPLNGDELRLRLLAACRVVESEARHRHISENASEGIVTVEQGDRIQYANAAAGTIFGYTRAELAGLDFAVIAPDFERHIAQSRSPAPEDGGDAKRRPASRTIELPGKHRSGRTIALDVSFSESRNSEHGRVLTAMIRDVTERRWREVSRTQAQKLVSIGQLAAGIAHEINSPIQYVGDNLQFLDESCASLQIGIRAHRRLFAEAKAGTIQPATLSEVAEIEQTVAFEYLEREMPSAIHQALEGVQHVAKIVRAMKEFAHPGDAEMAPADLNRLIETATVVCRNRWKCLAELITDLDPTLPLVPCIAGEISQVLLNLIVNAADAIEEVLFGRKETKGIIRISTRLIGGCAEVRVSDTGTGITPEVRARMFDLFFTTKPVGKGTGQGLALAYVTVVNKHHGTIDCETEAGAGTTFVVRLPMFARLEAAAGQLQGRALMELLPEAT